MNNQYAMLVTFSNADKDADCDVFLGAALEPEHMIAGVAALIDTMVDILGLENSQGEQNQDKALVYEKLMSDINDFSRLIVLENNDNILPRKVQSGGERH